MRISVGGASLGVLLVSCASPSLGVLLISCASPTPSEERWKAEWNARADAATTRWENPCGDPEFDPWADAFLEDCVPTQRLSGNECETRLRWVEARVRQCGAWQDYLLRNHGRRERVDSMPEPPTRID